MNVIMAAHMTLVIRHSVYTINGKTNLVIVQNFGKLIKSAFHSGQHRINEPSTLSRKILFRNRYMRIPWNAVNFRYNSTASANQASESLSFIPPPTDYIPPAPALPDLAETLNALGEPTLQSLGLGGYWPAGLVQHGLEWLHAGLGLPWWGSIVVGTLFVRLCMFPLVIKSQRMSMNMINHMPTVQRLQLKFSQARERGNMLEAMRYGSELADYMKRNNVKPFAQMLMPMCQLPIFLSVFVGLRRMANLPVESMTTGGCLWFPDLTVCEPVYGLPLLTAATFWLTLEVGSDGMAVNSQSHILKWFLRSMPLIMLPFITNFPTAMLVYWFTSNTFSLVQVSILKIPRIKSFFKIPDRVKHPEMEKTTKKGFIEGFKEAYGNMKATQQVVERQRLDELSFRKAAQGPITKTFSFDPKKSEINKSDSSKTQP